MARATLINVYLNDAYSKIESAKAGDRGGDCAELISFAFI